MGKKATIIRDLIYFDFDKIASIASQLDGGLLKEIQSTYEKIRELGGGLDVKLANLGGKASDSRGVIETRVIHHDLLIKVEDALFEAGIATDLNQEYQTIPDNVEKIHSLVTKKPYIRVQGKTLINDYERIKVYASAFNKITEFIRKSQIHTIEKTPQYQQLKLQIEEAKRQNSKNKDRNKSSQGNALIKKQEQEIEQAMEALLQNVNNTKLDDWLIEGIKEFIDLLLPKRMIFRLQPFVEIENLTILSNMKHQCFVDTDLDNIAFAYGSQPNVRLTVFGLVTSIPPQNPVSSSKEGTPSLTRKGTIEDFEAGFHKLFDATSVVENFGRFSRYPNITVYPLAVYRIIKAEAE